MPKPFLYIWQYIVFEVERSHGGISKTELIKSISLKWGFSEQDVSYRLREMARKEDKIYFDGSLVKLREKEE